MKRVKIEKVVVPVVEPMKIKERVIYVLCPICDDVHIHEFKRRKYWGHKEAVCEGIFPEREYGYFVKEKKAGDIIDF